MRSGPLQNKLILQTFSTTRDPRGTGQVVKTWADEVVIFGLLRPLVGREAVNAKEVKPEMTHKFITRHQRSLATIGPSKRFLSAERDRVFGIIDVVDLESRQKTLEIQLKELVGTTP